MEAAMSPFASPHIVPGALSSSSFTGTMGLGLQLFAAARPQRATKRPPSAKAFQSVGREIYLLDAFRADTEGGISGALDGRIAWIRFLDKTSRLRPGHIVPIPWIEPPEAIAIAVPAGVFPKELARLISFIAERTNSERVFDDIQSLYLSSNRPRDPQIAQRITAIHRDALAESERIVLGSLAQFARFFLTHPDLGLPKITLTPDGTLRARWIHGPGSFVAIEFTGEPLAKLVAEVPRDGGLTAPHFASEPLKSIVSVARAIGASFA